MSEYIYREATVEDIPFLVETVVEAERSGSDIIGLAKTFHIDELDLRKYLTQIFEEIDGCEFSVSSFFIAEYEGLPVAALGGWIEGKNENDLPSFILKSNLLSYILPKENFSQLYKVSEIIKDIQIEREPRTHQLEYGYVKPEHRGKGLLVNLVEKLLERAKLQDKLVKKSYGRILENNIFSIKMLQNSGYKIVKRFESKHPEILNYMPHNVILLMTREF